MDVLPLLVVAVAITVDIPVFMDALLLVRELNDVAPDDVYVIIASSQPSIVDAGKSTCTLVIPQFTVCDMSLGHSICILSSVKRSV